MTGEEEGGEGRQQMSRGVHLGDFRMGRGRSKEEAVWEGVRRCFEILVAFLATQHEDVLVM